ncbi:tetratricopeptide repeat protein [Sporosarcina sp. UB5]|uniref:tetratricopeptide repeat protein n=1 Tax=Sporosarcina sp. UB5 TaxID=3047463 RepID=UPI003D7A5429
MRHRYGRLIKKDNIVVFPGALERLIEKGLDAVEDTDYAEAVEAFAQAYHFEPDNTRILAPYAVSLYETKDFSLAKEVATKLLHSGTTDYLDAMELYLAISIQLQDYEEVEMTIETLFDEDIIPPDMVKKFNYLRDLNKRLSYRYIREDVEPQKTNTVTLEEFMEGTSEAQQQILAVFENSELDETTKNLLLQIVEKESLHPIIITYALVLLRESGFDEEVTVRKFGLTKRVIPAELELPSQDERSIKVVNQLGGLFEKDPTRMQMAIDASLRYGILAYPFCWDGFSTDEVVEAYMQYIESMFTGSPIISTDLNCMIKTVDEQPEK